MGFLLLCYRVEKKHGNPKSCHYSSWRTNRRAIAVNSRYVFQRPISQQNPYIWNILWKAVFIFLILKKNHSQSFCIPVLVIYGHFPPHTHKNISFPRFSCILQSNCGPPQFNLGIENNCTVVGIKLFAFLAVLSVLSLLKVTSDSEGKQHLLSRSQL